MPAPNQSIFQLVGHRGGESGLNSFIPEHSLAAYAIGASNGATFLEPDVISTKDHVLMVMHGNELGRTSDVSEHPEFADRYTTKLVDDGDGVTATNVTGWFSEDFTWEEVSTLRLRTVKNANPGPLDGLYPFVKFTEMLDYVDELNSQLK
jgi:glycerophosphoryl diester phosphodiesterase